MIAFIIYGALLLASPGATVTHDTFLRPTRVRDPDPKIRLQVNAAYDRRDSTVAKHSGRSSAIKPGPNSAAAAPCSQTAAEAASKAGMPCAKRPAVIPVSTSPAPAVARKAGALPAIAARPSGAATTVSAPLMSTTAPEIAAASLARSSFEPALVLLSNAPK